MINDDSHTCEGGVFAGYIKTFLNLKAEASGCLSWVRKPKGEEQYFENSYVIECVRLVRDAIKPNAANRGLAKLCLNSLWGKLTERQNQTQTRSARTVQILSYTRGLSCKIVVC